MIGQFIFWFLFLSNIYGVSAALVDKEWGAFAFHFISVVIVIHLREVYLRIK